MSVTLNIQPISLPITLDKNSVARVGGTQATLDTVIHAFVRRATAEEIAQQYPTLELSDIYATSNCSGNRSNKVGQEGLTSKSKTKATRAFTPFLRAVNK